MKKIYFGLLIIFFLFAAPTFAAAPKAWKPTTPNDYTPITWAKATGIASFFKAPQDGGAIDFLTRIYLPQNQIKFILSAPASTGSGAANAASAANPAETIAPTPDVPASNGDIGTFPNLSFTRLGAEAAKTIDPTVKFIWDVAFFNMRPVSSDLSMALKYTENGNTTVSSGSRSSADMALPRRMLIVNNQTGKATIKDFDAAAFIDDKNGDQAIEGFSPVVVKTDGPTAAASRLFLGVSNDGKELTVYCSQLASVKEASDALTAAGVSPEHQLEADGGGSAACGYNLPGQFFVEPTRTLPLLMGATTIVARGTVNASSMNVRSGPGTKYPIVAKLPKGTAIQAFGESNGWYRIGDGKWAIKSLIK